MCSFCEESHDETRDHGAYVLFRQLEQGIEQWWSERASPRRRLSSASTSMSSARPCASDCAMNHVAMLAELDR